MKTIVKHAATIVLVGLFVFTYYNYSIEKVPINNSKHFFKNRLNQVFIDGTTGCLDICLFRTFKKIPADQNTFTVYVMHGFDTGYAKDKNDVYYKFGEVMEADSNSFQVVGRDLAKDKHGYILYKTRLADYITEEIDGHIELKPESVEVLGYETFRYILIRSDEVYYLVKLNPQPKSITQVTEAEAQSYIKIL